MLKIKLFLLAFLSVALLNGCASTSSEDEHLSVEQLYNRGHDLLAKTKYKKAETGCNLSKYLILIHLPITTNVAP